MYPGRQAAASIKPVKHVRLYSMDHLFTPPLPLLPNNRGHKDCPYASSYGLHMIGMSAKLVISYI